MELWDSVIGAQLGASVASVHVIEWLKKSKLFPWLTIDTATANRYVSIGLAAVSALGFQWAMEGSFIEGGKLSIQIPPLTETVAAIFRFSLSYGAQQAYYKNAVAAQPPPVQVFQENAVNQMRVTPNPPKQE